ncbi:Up-regulated during septation-domain-containing protein [Triangularia verruculosa]|uniref:Up-regulated during septation-domain-containing protein n=1 Tax=Triangularia verruculosa TaxID=2587418 RepID=A0AAN6X8T5_9PEZI|nr:Up-regulated during septation-domain-containing protein [Triangularia verruculosa]
MNGAATRRGGSGGGGVGGRGDDSYGRMPAPAVQPPPLSNVVPTGKALVDGYRNEILEAADKTRLIPLNTDGPQTSPLVDLKDSIQVHLLTETALSDSKSYEILSQEEVDSLKKQMQSLGMRVEQARANLAIQSKYRDAAVSMAKLYSPGGKRKSLLGNRMSDSAKEAEMEKAASERRCEELASELFQLEKSLMQPQRRLLQHTAGILQLTHRASSKKPGQPQLLGQPMMNGMPGSPESLYTYTNTRNSMEIPNEQLDFNNKDKDLYLSLESDGSATTRARKNTLEIPIKSPIREQNAQLRELREEVERYKEEITRMKEENEQLKTAEQQLRSENTLIKEEHDRVLDEHAQLKRSEEQLSQDYARAEAEKARLEEMEEQLREEHARALEENTRMKDETTRSKDESGSRLQEADSRMRAIEQDMGARMDALQAQTSEQQRTISIAESRLEDLNDKLRDMIIAFNPTKNEGFGHPEADTLEEQLDYLENGLNTAIEEQRQQSADLTKTDKVAAEAAAASSEAATLATTLSKVESSFGQTEIRLQNLNRQVLFILQQANVDQAPPPEGDLNVQLNYLEDSIDKVSSEIGRVVEASMAGSASKRDLEQVDAVLVGLWEIIQTGYAEIARQKAARKQARALGQGTPDEDEDLSSNEFEGDTNEPYSLPAFSAKVQWLYAQATGLREQKYILQRQIKQQRELNNRSESEKDQELQAKKEELEKTHMLLDDSELAAQEAQEKLQKVLIDLDSLQKASAANETASSSSVKVVQDQLKERNAQLSALESEYSAVQARLATVESNMSSVQNQLIQANESRVAAENDLADLKSQLATASEASATASKEIEKLQSGLKQKDEELEAMNMMVIELKTEMTIAKAELDGAYGSRKQRAAEAAKFTNTAETAELNAQVVKLRSELEAALRDLEDITKESINAEKEKLDLESKLDDAVAVKVRLEQEVKVLRDRLDKAKEELDKERLKPPNSPVPGGGAGAGAGRAGATMLSEQFRATMKEERKKFQEELREEQSRRRKVEDELRALKRGTATAASAGSRGGLLSPR